MEIPVGKNYRIISDSDQWIVQKRFNRPKSKTPKGWTNLGYYTDIGYAIERLADKRIRQVDGLITAKVVQEAIAQIAMESSEASRAIKKAISGSSEPSRDDEKEKV